MEEAQASSAARGKARDEIKRELVACQLSIQSRSIFHELTLFMRRGVKDPEASEVVRPGAKFEAAKAEWLREYQKVARRSCARDPADAT